MPWIILFLAQSAWALDFPNLGFKIDAPQGWEVVTTNPNISLVLQPPHSTDGFQSSIQVMRFNGPVYIDDRTAQETADLITKNFGQAAGQGAGYKLRDQSYVNLNNGALAVMYYADFTLSGQELIQAHLLTSSATHHYLITFTDLASHFANEKSPTFFEPAWDAMISFTTDTQPPWQYGTLALIGSAVAVFLLLLLGVFIYRRSRQHILLDREQRFED